MTDSRRLERNAQQQSRGLACALEAPVQPFTEQLHVGLHLLTAPPPPPHTHTHTRGPGSWAAEPYGPTPRRPQVYCKRQPVGGPARTQTPSAAASMAYELYRCQVHAGRTSAKWPA